MMTTKLRCIDHAADAATIAPFCYCDGIRPAWPGSVAASLTGPYMPPLPAPFRAFICSFIEFFMSSFIMLPNSFRSSGVEVDPPEQPNTQPTRPSIRSGTNVRTNRMCSID
jgi:hypothetical protein